MNNIKTLILLSFFAVILFFPSTRLTAQNNTQKQTSNDRYFRIMFYNCENFFNVTHDTLKLDDQFLPDGDHYWNWGKYKHKVNNIAKVITAVGGWTPPDIVGLCEVENRYCLESLTKFSPLEKFNYQIIHKESPDRRGIDVAFLYQENTFTPISNNFIQIDFPFNKDKKTRDILYVTGYTNKHDTLHIFVNHWPSRWGGQLESEPNRMFVASVLKNSVDSIFETNKNANIIIMGDLNDEPDNKSLLETLKAHGEFNNIKNKELYNLSYYLQFKKNICSHKYQGHWGTLDQIIVSGNLLLKNKKLYTSLDDAHVFKADFLLEKDDSYYGLRPFRTYLGFKYHGGFSDHLPVYLDLQRKN
ncbi:MAG: endonuclease [Bacteroidales bacterium]|nr:endonuclease [Bacteroidales bacterium]